MHVRGLRWPHDAMEDDHIPVLVREDEDGRTRMLLNGSNQMEYEAVLRDWGVHVWRMDGGCSCGSSHASS